MEKITETQMKILTHIATFTDERGYQPSYREIAAHFGWTSLGYIAYVIRRMKKLGLIVGSGPRAIEFAGDWRNYVSAGQDAPDLQGSQSSW